MLTKRKNSVKDGITYFNISFAEKRDRDNKKLSVKVLYEYLSRDYLYGHSVI